MIIEGNVLYLMRQKLFKAKTLGKDSSVIPKTEHYHTVISANSVLQDYTSNLHYQM